jgi:hypothetical protein
MKIIKFPSIILTGLVVSSICSCKTETNRLVGHSYTISPINDAVRLKLSFSSAKITHEYENNSTVRVVTYIYGTPSKTEELSYSVDGNTYTMDNEVYNLSFKNDTVVLSVDTAEFIRLIPIK